MRNYILSVKCLLIMCLPTDLFGQLIDGTDHSGAWPYEIKGTPYGDYAGTIYLWKTNQSYTGKIINAEGKEYHIEVLRSKEDRMIFSSNIEETQSLFSCLFIRDSLIANIEVKGDDFLYKITSKKQPHKK